MDIILEHIGELKYKVKGLRLFEYEDPVKCGVVKLLAANREKKPVGWVELTVGSIVSVDREVRNIYVCSEKGKIMVVNPVEFFNALRDYEPTVDIKSITVYGSGAIVFKLPGGDIDVEVTSICIYVRRRRKRVLVIIKDLEAYKEPEGLFKVAVENLGNEEILLIMLSELRGRKANLEIGTIRELYVLLNEKPIIPLGGKKPEGRMVIKSDFSRRPGFDFLKYEEGEIKIIEVKGGRPEDLGRLKKDANKRLAPKFDRLKKMLDNLGLKELKIRLRKVGEVELIVETEFGEVPLHIKGYVYKIVGSPFKKGTKAYGFEEGSYLISIKELPEEVKVNLDKAYLEAVLEYLREGKIEIKTVEFKPKVEKRGKLVWEENVISVFPIQL